MTLTYPRNTSLNACEQFAYHVEQKLPRFETFSLHTQLETLPVFRYYIRKRDL